MICVIFVIWFFVNFPCFIIGIIEGDPFFKNKNGIPNLGAVLFPGYILGFYLAKVLLSPFKDWK